MDNTSQASTVWYPPVYIITGEQGAGKTSFLMNLLMELIETDLKIRGIVSPGYFEDGIRSGFSIIDVATGNCEKLSSVIPSPDCEKHGRFYFRLPGLACGYHALKSHERSESGDLIVIDEVGRFEMEGEVWSDCIDNLVSTPHPPMIWTVRRSLVDAVIERYSVIRPVVIEVGMACLVTITKNLIQEVRTYRSMSGRKLE